MKKLLAAAFLLALPFASLKEIASMHTGEPGLASCGPEKPVLVSRFGGSPVPNTYYRLILNADLDKFNLGLLDSEGFMVYTWYGFVADNEDKTFSVFFEGNRIDVMTKLPNPCTWLYPGTQ